MRSSRAAIAAAVMVTSLLTGCSGAGDGGDRTAETKGRTAAEVCGGFAGEPSVAEALAAIAGEGVPFSSDTVRPEKVITDLQKAARAPQSGKRWMDGVPFCELEQAHDGRRILDITVREALAVPAHDGKVSTAYSSGLRATSSDLFAAVYFSCQLKAPAHEIIVVAELQRPLDHPADHPGIRDDQVTVVNAAARRVAADLGCADTRLAAGAPVVR
ncbi:hypothetical protein [Streptomyces sp.]|uniref:hypothetical protein n=1 Tax=Streptomyces sp. TaxID=1931 RepID=UPI0028125E83|nr:hypothetical protein [Streptomyces sp.]